MNKLIKLANNITVFVKDKVSVMVLYIALAMCVSYIIHGDDVNYTGYIFVLFFWGIIKVRQVNKFYELIVHNPSLANQLRMPPRGDRIRLRGWYGWLALFIKLVILALFIWLGIAIIF